MPGQTSSAGADLRGRRDPSMEGRAIARPNSGHPTGGGRSKSAFNGGPGNCPAKRRLRRPDPAGHSPSMEGRAIARPNWGRPSDAVQDEVPSMEGRAIARPNPTPSGAWPDRPTTFNGGPGNCPAKPAPGRSPVKPTRAPSMEGRAIARPNASDRDVAGVLVRSPSMEGRAIARPNDSADVDGCRIHNLQWRAGQLPGQTPPSATTSTTTPTFNGGPGNCPAKRCGSRLPTRAAACPFNGGPGNCPAKQRGTAEGITAEYRLQWRAGQLPGQTGPSPAAIGETRSTFNGGPGNCPAKPRGRPLVLHAAGPSMEGRAIARPNLVETWTCDEPEIRLQWRAGQLPGQTRARVGAVRGTRPPFNGGPGNCPAKPGTPKPAKSVSRFLQWRAGQLPGQTPTDLHRRASHWPPFNGGPGNCPAKPRRRRQRHSRRNRPSMEGRAIARPNQNLWGAWNADDWRPSMEGRAIARPNPALDLPDDIFVPNLQWRAGQLPGQTCWSWPHRRSTHNPFNGGPGNCPAKRLAGPDPNDKAITPSMEGRAIARPNLHAQT